jgi:flagellar motor switch protein FliN/FliY
MATSPTNVEVPPAGDAGVVAGTPVKESPGIGSRSTGRGDGRGPDLQRILGLSVPVAVVLAESERSIQAILDIKFGTIIEFDVPFDSDLVLYAADRQIGNGQAVKVGENFGLRVNQIGTVRERINALGGE